MTILPHEPMPEAMDAERALLGGLLRDPGQLDDISLDSEAFYKPEHGALLRLLRSMHSKGEPIDLVTVAARIAGRRQTAYGGVAYVTELPEHVPSTANLAHYAQRIEEKHQQRETFRLGRQLAESAVNGGDITTVIEQGNQRLLTLVRDNEKAEETTETSTGLPELPLDGLPAQDRQWIRSMALSIKGNHTAPLLMNALSSASFGMLGRYKVEVLPGWKQELALWSLTVGETGLGKSPLLDVFVDVAAECEEVARKEASDGRETRKIRHEAAKKLHETAAKQLVNLQIANTSEQDIEAAERKLVQAECVLKDSPAPAPKPSYIHDDITPEAFVTHLQRQGSVLLSSAEASKLFKVIDGGRYSSGQSAWSPFLHGYDGEETRSTRQTVEDRHVKRALCTMMLATQPTIVRKLSDGADEEGALGRFCWVMMEDNRGSRSPIVPMAPELRELARKRLRKLFELRDDWARTHRESTVGGHPTDEPGLIRLSASAADQLRAYDDELEFGLQHELRPIASWVSKAPARAARIAAIVWAMHCADSKIDPSTKAVPGHVMEYAIRLSRALMAHARAGIALARQDPKAKAEPSAYDKARSWLLETLTDKPMAPKDLWPLAAKAGHSKATLRRVAKDEACIQTIKKKWTRVTPV